MKVLYFLICVLFPAIISAFCGFVMEYAYKRNVLSNSAAAKANYMDAFPAMAAIYAVLLVLGGLIMYFRRPLYPYFAAVSAILAVLFAALRYFSLKI